MPSSSPLSFRQLVATQFANRPRLREVIARAGFEVIAARYPWTRSQHPHLQSIQGFSILRGVNGQPPTASGQLVDTLLTHFFTGQPMALQPTDQLSMDPPAVFRPQDSDPAIDLRMEDLNTDFDNMLSTLSETFQRAQVSFWNGCEKDSDVTRLQWLQQLLKAALLGTLERQGLDHDQKALLYALLAQSHAAAQVQALQVFLARPGDTLQWVLPDLLVTGRQGARELILWCQPSGTVRSFDDLAAFSLALREALYEQHAFDSMSWACTPLREDPFAYQARQLLNGLLQRIDRLQLRPGDKASDLDERFYTLSDPSWVFPASFVLQPSTPAIGFPDWLGNASLTDRFEYHTALLALSARQMLAQGGSSLDGIEDLQQYAVRRLREHMRNDHPAQAPYDPDQLLISLAQVVQVSSTGPARLEHLRTISLTELAITRLPPGGEQVAAAIQRADQQPLDSWMNLDYVATLVDSVDIGGQYPQFVHDQLQRGNDADQRRQRFAEEWRTSLLLSGLQAKIMAQLDERTWQVIADFCRRQPHASGALKLAPLAFNSVPGGPKSNPVHGMFVIEVPTTGAWLLYRPLHTRQPIRQFDSRHQLITCIRTEHALQQDILIWLDDDARPIYANGGFVHPHLHSGLAEVAHLLAPGAALVGLAIERLRVPVSLAFSPWADDLDSRLYQARAEVLLLLASRQSVSNQQLRWALVEQFAWVAFNTVTPLLRGPAGMLAWLVTALLGIRRDLTVLTEGSDQEKWLAGADILLNLAMLLAHGPAVARTPPEPAYHAPPRRAPAALAEPLPEQQTWTAFAEPAQPTALNVSQWGHDQRLGNLPRDARAALERLRAPVSLSGLQPLASGRMRGLYALDGRYYVQLQHVPYEVVESWSGMRIMGPPLSQSEWSQSWGAEPDGYYLPSRERSRGPWLKRWNGEWMLDLHLAGGMPKSARALIDEKTQAFNTLLATRVANDQKLNNTETFVGVYLKRVEPYDQALEAFLKSLDEHPGASLDNLPEHLQESLRALQALRQETRANLDVLALTYEKQATLIREQIQLYTRMGEPKYLRFDPQATASFARGQWWEQLLQTDLQQFRRLLDMNDYEVLKSQSRRLVQLPFGQEQAELYLDYSKNIEAALAVHRRILSVSQRLDQNLAEALQDGQIQFPGKRKKLDGLISTRQYSTLITRAQIISDLHQLIVRRDRLSADDFESTLLAQQTLRSKHFHEALLSHDSLAAAGLTPEQQKAPLESAVREYKLALSNAQYLLSRNMPAVDSSQLEAYIAELNALISLGEDDMANLAAATDRQDAVPEQPLTHRVRAVRRKVIRTARGRSLVVEETEEAGETVQIDPMTQQTVARYQQQGDHWDTIAPAPPAPDYARLRRIGNDLLSQQAARLNHAARHLDGPNSLADLLDFYLQDLAEIAGNLRSGPDREQPLASRIEQAITEVRAEKQRLLTCAYLGTRYPDSKALRFLVEAHEVEIAPNRARKQLKANDFLDVYDIYRRQPRQKLWEAHFHYTTANANARRFAKGHLKFPEAMGRDERLQRAQASAERCQVYRGDLRLDQIEDLIPFPAS
ncbi:hypothetical protein [Pseudomonas sp. FYR_11]|uniref:hypothetical protein n=1 Tax=Pseudomonas TaxID=286 RepID=UPI00370CC3DE